MKDTDDPRVMTAGAVVRGLKFCIKRTESDKLTNQCSSSCPYHNDSKCVENMMKDVYCLLTNYKKIVESSR